MRQLYDMKLEEYKNSLISHGIRPLNHRVAVYAFLKNNPIHPTADEIYKNLKGSLSSISRTTVYNVLHLLSEKGIVKALSIENNEVRYDATITDHVHFKCESCGVVYDMTDQSFPIITVDSGYIVKEVQISVVGKCPSCSQN